MEGGSTNIQALEPVKHFLEKITLEKSVERETSSSGKVFFPFKKESGENHSSFLSLDCCLNVIVVPTTSYQ